MKLRMKKMPRPLDLRMFSGARGSATSCGSKPCALVQHADDEFLRVGGWSERELDGHELAVIFAVAVLDRVDHRLAHRHTNPVDGVLVESGELAHAVADDLHEIQHVEVTVDLKADGTSAGQHAERSGPAPVRRVAGRKLSPMLGSSTRVNNILNRIDSRTRMLWGPRRAFFARWGVIVRPWSALPPMPRWSAPRRGSRGASAYPATNRFPTGTRSSAHSPTAPPASRTIRLAPTAPPRWRVFARSA